MNQFSTAPSTRLRSKPTAGLPALLPLLAMILAAAPAAWAGTTDISTQPLVTLPTAQAKPNLLFVMDSSGSMNWSYMPDNLGNSVSINNEPWDGHNGRKNWYGYWSPQCNGLAFDPSADYSPPLKADGTSYSHASFTNAAADGYASAGNTTFTDLSSSADAYYYKYNGNETVMSWTYDTNGVVKNNFYNECSTVVTSPDPSIFTKVSLSSASSDIQQKYADWYSYYSHRYLLMRTAMGRAISVLDSNYRVGFSTIYDTQAKDGTTNFVDVKDFDATQKGKFYTSLYAVAPSGGTNLPDALSEAGRYYAHKIANQTADPVQYACQRNYTLLSTDGYWNTNSLDYGLDGNRVGQQDGDEKRPMKDNNGDVLKSTATPFTAPATNETVTTQTRDVIWTHWTGTVSKSGPGTKSTGGITPGNCKRTGYYLLTGNGKQADEAQKWVTDLKQTGNSTYTETIVTVAVTNGATLSDTVSAAVAGNWDTGTTTNTYTDNGATATDSTPHMPASSAYGASGSVSVCTNVTPLPTKSGDDSSVIGAWSSDGGVSAVTITGGYVAGTPTVTTSTATGSSDTLADVAEYYYKTDLRSKSFSPDNCSSTSSGGTQDVCANIVKPTTTDPATWQHMNTFTIGLGTSGTLKYDKNYLTQSSGTYVDLTSGAAIWPSATASANAVNIDDLWHAAVNGRGQYYSALNATLLAEAISGVVNIVQQQTGSGASASTSSLQLVAGDNNLVYQASYTTGSWSGDLLAYGINGDDGSIDTSFTWSAQDKLDKLMDKQTTSQRTIYFNSGSSTAPTLALMNWSNLSTAQQAYFANVCPTSPATSGVTPKATLLGQCSGLTGADLTAANNGSNMLDYLSGVRTYESKVDGTTTVPLYRSRDHVLGDIIDGAPVYIGKPPFKYSDAGYADFVSAQSGRKAVVYTAGNDGMLHAFSAAGSDGGKELWAFVPTPMMSNLYLLADTSYASRHRYFVDGAPVMGDIKVGSTWKTILVGGFNDGGKGYYCLDITNPTSPTLLWEFTDTNLGLSYGNPVITKRVDPTGKGNGTWVVVFGSGYNNADGLGHLFVVDANAGTKSLDITTPAGSVNVASATNPSGLSKINAWIESDTDNTATRFYGGDLLGNLWRFDIDKQVQPNQSAMLLAQFLLPGNVPQPITTRPEPIAAPTTTSTRAVIIVGTGRYLGTSDISDKTQQSIYAIADDLTSTGWGDVRSGPNKSKFVQQTLTLDSTSTPTAATDSNTAVSFADPNIAGWWLDLPNSGERVATNMSVQFNTLVVGSAIPTGNVCDSGGKSWRYFLNATSGGAVSTNPVGALWDANALMVGQGWIVDAAGNTRILEVGSNGKIKTEIPPTIIPSPSGGGHRTSWRELTN